MGFLADGLQPEVKATDASALTWAKLMGLETSSKAGVSVNIDSALKVSTVFACLRVLANGIAQVPLKLYRETANDSKEVAKDHPVHKLIWRRPNAWMTSFEWRQMSMFHAVLTGAAVSYVGRVRGQPRELIPLVPGTFKLCQGADRATIVELSEANGVRRLGPDEVFILRGPMWTGVAGLDALHYAREAIGLAIVTEETHAALHANGAMPGGILSVKSALGDDGKKRLKTSWQEYQAGLRNKFKTAVLDMEATWTPMAATGVDNQHLETRRFQIEEICRDLGVFPQMVCHTDKTATFASSESFFQAHVIHDLNPWVENWEQALALYLFPDADDLAAKFSMQGLMRGDNKTRAEFYASGIVNGWMSRNEARRLEDMNPLPGLDEPLLPLNMTTQAERDLLAAEVTDVVKSMIGHNGGPALDDSQLAGAVGRALSAAHQRQLAQRTFV